MKKTIIISIEDRDYIQRLDIEMSARQNIISFMLSNNMNTDTEQFKNYQREYNEYFLQFDKAKNDIIVNNYIIKEFPNYNNLNWTLDYNTREIIIN